MSGTLRTLAAALGATFDWLAKGEMSAASRLLAIAGWFHERSRAEPRWPQGP